MTFGEALRSGKWLLHIPTHSYMDFPRRPAVSYTDYHADHVRLTRMNTFIIQFSQHSSKIIYKCDFYMTFLFKRCWCSSPRTYKLVIIGVHQILEIFILGSSVSRDFNYGFSFISNNLWIKSIPFSFILKKFISFWENE